MPDSSSVNAVSAKPVVTSGWSQPAAVRMSKASRSLTLAFAVDWPLKRSLAFEGFEVSRLTIEAGLSRSVGAPPHAGSLSTSIAPSLKAAFSNLTSMSSPIRKRCVSGPLMLPVIGTSRVTPVPVST